MCGDSQPLKWWILTYGFNGCRLVLRRFQVLGFIAAQGLLALKRWIRELIPYLLIMLEVWLMYRNLNSVSEF